MKIGEINSAGRPASVKKKGNRGQTGDFSSLIDSAETEEETSAPGKMAGLNPVASVGALLAVQEYGNEEEKRKKKIEHGKNLLSYLDEIHSGLLAGSISPQTVKNLATEIRSKQQDIADSHLNELLKEIEVRAEVELAKIELLQKNI